MVPSATSESTSVAHAIARSSADEPDSPAKRKGALLNLSMSAPHSTNQQRLQRNFALMEHLQQDFSKKWVAWDSNPGPIG